MPTNDNLILARGRLLARYGTLWKAAAAIGGGFSSNWLGKRLSGATPIEPELAAWLARQTGLAASVFASAPPPTATTPPASAAAETDDLPLERIEL